MFQTFRLASWSTVERSLQLTNMNKKLDHVGNEEKHKANRDSANLTPIIPLPFFFKKPKKDKKRKEKQQQKN